MKVKLNNVFITSCCVLWFLLTCVLAIGLGISLALKYSSGDGGGVDASDYGTCHNNVLTVERLFVWNTYPRAPKIFPLMPPNQELLMFEGKNGVIWSDDDTIVTFRIPAASGSTLSIQEMFNDRFEEISTIFTIPRTCHFTLDSAGQQNACCYSDGSTKCPSSAYTSEQKSCYDWNCKNYKGCSCRTPPCSWN